MEASGQLHMPGGGEGTSLPSVYEGGRWTSDQVWAIKKKEKSRIPAEIPSLDRSSHSLVAIPTALCPHHNKFIGTVLSILGLQVSKIIGLYEDYDISIHANL